MYYFSILSCKISSHTWIAIMKYSVLHFWFNLHFLKYAFHSRIVSVDWFIRFFFKLLYLVVLFSIFLLLVDIYVFLPSNWFLVYLLFVLIKDNYFVSKIVATISFSLCVVKFLVVSNVKFLIVFDLLYLWNFLFVLLLLAMSFKQLISSCLLLLCLVELFIKCKEMSFL